MPYVRQRGNQILIVHGERDPKTRAVEQRVLYAIRTRDEAEAIGGAAEDDIAHRFRSLLEHHHPDLRFDWKRLGREIGRYAKALPEQSSDQGLDPATEFRSSLCSFVRQLHRTDPQDLDTSVQVIERNRADLEYVCSLIRWRLDVPRSEPDQFSKDDAFHWRYFLHGSGVPPEAEEEVAELFEKGDSEKAAALARLLIDSYEGYAEGHNYLGLLALRRGDLKDAESEFRRTMTVARATLPAKVRRTSWWRDLATRPYMRGLRNLTLSLMLAGRWDDAARCARQLEDECADVDAASVFLATISLSTGRHGDALERASRLRVLWPEEGFVAAFAAAELSRWPEALELFLHAAIHRPHTAQRLVRGKVQPAMRDVATIDDARAGRDADKLDEYLRRRRRALRRGFEPILDDPRVIALLRESADVERGWSTQRGASADRRFFERMNAMRKPEFAAGKAREWADLVATSAKGTVH
ncbi:MAG: hypothetical protein WCJ30_24765 [Deltaproteobacteria bacterium]